MNLGVIGAGPVGLVTAGGFASLGHHVMCAERDTGKLESLSKGDLPIYEPGLAELIAGTAEDGSLSFTGSLERVLDFATVIFICVGTPEGDDGAADLSQVDAVAHELAATGNGFRLLIEKSTVPIGTYTRIAQTIKRHCGPEFDFEVVCVPEFLREGAAVEDFFNPDRMILGVSSPRSRELVEQLYGSFTCPKIWTDPGTAELVKYASNSFLALKISYANLLADVCEGTGANLEQLLDGVGADARVGRRFMNAGVGYGGSCLPKDVQAFIHIARISGADPSLLDEAEAVNDRRPGQLVNKLRTALGPLRGRNITVWGLSFKPETDDVRNAPSIQVVKALADEGASVTCHDPVATETFKAALGEVAQVTYEDHIYLAVVGADALVLVTEWDHYLDADLSKVKSAMARPLIVDGRAALNRQTATRLGFDYLAFGLSDSVASPGITVSSESLGAGEVKPYDRL